MDTQTLFRLVMYILRALLCLLFILSGMFVIAIAAPFDMIWTGGFVLIGLGIGGVIIQLFSSYRDAYANSPLKDPTRND